MTKRTIAREWLWFVGSVPAVAAIYLISEFTADPVEALIIAAMSYPAVVVLRVTVWALALMVGPSAPSAPVEASPQSSLPQAH